MQVELDLGALRLGPGQSLKVRNGGGSAIRVEEGSVWITEEGNPADIFLEPGQQFVLAGKGLAIIDGLWSSLPAAVDKRRTIVPGVSAGIVLGRVRSTALHQCSMSITLGDVLLFIPSRQPVLARSTHETNR